MKHFLCLALAAALGATLLPPLPAAATPPPPPRERTDCAAKVYIVDDMVCESPDLMRLDGLAADRWTSLPPGSHPAWPSLVEAQRDWYWRRGKCVDARDQRRCLETAYNDRLEVLAALAQPPDRGVGDPVECDGPPWGRQRLLLTPRAGTGAVIVTNAEGVVMAVASEPNSDGWTPAVALKWESGGGVEFDPSGDGPLIVCRPA